MTFKDDLSELLYDNLNDAIIDFHDEINTDESREYSR